MICSQARGSKAFRDAGGRCDEAVEKVRATLAMQLLCSLVPFVGLHLPLKAWEPAQRAGGQLGEYLASLKDDRLPIFVSDCQLNDQIKAAIVFRSENTTVKFFLINDRGRSGTAIAGTVAELGVDKGAVTVLRGDWSPDDQQAFQQLIVNLIASPFLLLPPGRIDEIFTEPGQERC